MSYFDRVRVTHHEPTLADKLKKMEEALFGVPNPETVNDKTYLDDDPVADGLGTLSYRTAVQKKADDDYAEQSLRLLV